MLVQKILSANASVDKLVESPGFHPGVLPVQVRPEVPFIIVGYSSGQRGETVGY